MCNTHPSNTQCLFYSLFEQLKITNGAIRVIDFAKVNGISKSTASRYLAKQEQCNVLVQNPDSSYSAGKAFLQLIEQVLRNRPLLDLLYMSLNIISEKMGYRYTTYISMLDRDDVIVVLALPGWGKLDTVTPPRERLPANQTATGRVLLARIPESKIKQYLIDNEMYNDEILDSLSEIRKNGYAFTISEHLKGVASIATGICDPRSDDSYSLCMSFPSKQLDKTPGLEAEITRILYNESIRVGRIIGDQYWINRQNQQ